MKYILKIISIISFICFYGYSKAEDISVITRFPPSSPSYQSMFFFIKKINSLQTEYNFIPKNVPGAIGENADQLALTLAKNGSKVLWYGPLSSFTLNRFELPKTYDRDNDFFFIRSLLTTHQTIVVSKNNNIKTLNELVKSLRNKKESFYGAPIEVGAAEFLSNIFTKHYNLNSKMIKYKTFGEITTALINKEVDYSIYTAPIANNDNLLVLEISKYDQNTIPNFKFETLSSFAVPSSIKEFGLNIKPLFDKLCNDPDLVEIYKKFYYQEACYDNSFIKQRIKEEVEWIKNIK